MDIPSSIKEKFSTIKIEKHPKSICIANYKGGVGKTTMTTLLGYYLAHYKKKKVLLIDIDPQCSLSLATGFNLEDVNKTDFTIYHLVTPNKWSKITKVKFRDYIDNVPDKFAHENLKIIKGSFEVDELDLLITREVVVNDGADDMLFNYCRNMLNEFSDFDYILIDCPPNKMYLTQAMLRASSYYISVTIPDKISVYGMPRLLKWVKKIPLNEKPKLLGCVLNCVNRAGGNEFGTINQQQAYKELLKSIKQDLDSLELKVISDKPVLGHVPRLDAISKFLSQGDDKTAWHELKKSGSEQDSVSTVMMNIINRIETKINEYAKI